MTARQPKRFYKMATVAASGDAFVLQLDGKAAKTARGGQIATEISALAEAIAAEWNAQGERIDFLRMPMTRFLGTTIDLGGDDAGKWRETWLAFLKSEHLCYRATAPSELVERQRGAWDPLLDWAALSFEIRLATGAGVSFIAQPPDTLAAGARLIKRADAANVLGMKEAAEISGSAVIALALSRRAFPSEVLFGASRVDEDFQTERWGEDAEAADRRAGLRIDFLDAARFLDLVNQKAR